MDAFRLNIEEWHDNLNNDFAVDLQEELAINRKVYDNYTNAYIKKQGTEESPLWQIFANHLKTLS